MKLIVNNYELENKFGVKEINGEATLISDNFSDFDNLLNKLYSIDLIADDNENQYILKDCVITGYDVSIGDADSIVENTVAFKAKNLKPIIFKDGRHKITQEDYDKVKEDISNLEDITYEEFMDRVMVEEL